MLLPYFGVQAGLQIAGSMRRELASVLAADPACPLCTDVTAGAYRLLRSAENLELYCTLHQNHFLLRPFDLCGVCRCVFSAAQDVISYPANTLHCVCCSQTLAVSASQSAFITVLLNLICNSLLYFSAAQDVISYPANTLHCVCCSQTLAVSASQSAFITVLLNLICNSLLYGGAKPVVRLRVFRQGNRAVMIFSDNGPGIPLHRQHRALAPFETNSHLPGFGLGLPITELFCHRSHGTFTLESQPGKGVRIALSLPLCSASHLSATPDPAALLADRFSPIYTQLSPRCILPD